MEQPTTVTKFRVNNKDVFVQLTWKANDTDIFHIKIFDQNTTWSGRYSREFADQFRKNTDETAEEYLTNVKKGLRSEDDSFTYELSELSEDSAKFSWKKQYDGSTVRMLHGSVPVHIDEHETKESLIDYLLNESQELRKTIETLTTENNRLSSNLKTCKMELYNFVNMKSSMEHSLYGKFVKLLNAKKRRINLLEESLNIEDGDPD